MSATESQLKRWVLGVALTRMAWRGSVTALELMVASAVLPSTFTWIETSQTSPASSLTVYSSGIWPSVWVGLAAVMTQGLSWMLFFTSIWMVWKARSYPPPSPLSRNQTFL